MRKLVAVLVLMCSAWLGAGAQELELAERALRSTSGFGDGAPVSRYRVVRGKLQNEILADGVTYHYRYYAGKRLIARKTRTTPARGLPRLSQPFLQISKRDYVLTVFDRGKVVKRYPFAMGSLPRNRKLTVDYASTPEGDYTVYNLQPDATYYRALDLDYPNSIDKLRYQFALDHGLARPVGIGGEIQIHGMGSHRNWTHGCVALENGCMDELFEQPALRAGTPVRIYGFELELADFDSIEQEAARAKEIQKRLKQLGFYRGDVDGMLGPQSRFALGRFQRSRKLPPTLQLDRRTARALLER